MLRFAAIIDASCFIFTPFEACRDADIADDDYARARFTMRAAAFITHADISFSPLRFALMLPR